MIGGVDVELMVLLLTRGHFDPAVSCHLPVVTIVTAAFAVEVSMSMSMSVMLELKMIAPMEKNSLESKQN